MLLLCSPPPRVAQLLRPAVLPRARVCTRCSPYRLAVATPTSTCRARLLRCSLSTVDRLFRRTTPRSALRLVSPPFAGRRALVASCFAAALRLPAVLQAASQPRTLREARGRRAVAFDAPLRSAAGDLRSLIASELRSSALASFLTSRRCFTTPLSLRASSSSTVSLCATCARLVGRSSSALSPPFRRCTALRRRP